MDFAAVTDEVYRLYREGRYREGAALVAGARQHLPKRDSRLTFWKACFRSMAGSPETAVEILRAGTARGLWWPEGMLADRDLDAARVLNGWSVVVAPRTLTNGPGWMHGPPCVSARDEAEPCSHYMVRTLIPSSSPTDGRRGCQRSGVW